MFGRGVPPLAGRLNGAGHTGVGMRNDMVVSYVRDLLERLTGQRPEPDHDGDLPVPYRGALFYVRIIGADPVVQVFAIAVSEIKGSAKLHAELNDINSRLEFARAFHVDGQVLIEHDIWATDVNFSNFDHACRNVASGADLVGRDLAQRFGGIPFFEERKTSEYSTSPSQGAFGFTARAQ